MIRAVIAMLVTLAATATSAQTFTPAILKSLDLSRELKCKDSDTEPTVFACGVVVDEAGDVERRGTDCAAGGRQELRRSKQVERVLRHATFEPATVDGVAEKVALFMRVGFRKQEDRCEVFLYSNLGLQEEELGENYLGPQERVSHGSWYDRVPRDNRPLVIRKFRFSTFQPQSGNMNGLAFLISVSVDEAGIASDGRVDSNAFADESNLAVAVESLEQSTFIPPFANGVPVADRFYTFFQLW